MTSGLCVNMSKSKIFGRNFKEDFLSSTLTFLSYPIGSFRFNFLGISVGVYPRIREAWSHIVKR